MQSQVMNPKAQGNISTSLPPHSSPNLSSSSTTTTVQAMASSDMFRVRGTWDLVLLNEELDNFIVSLFPETPACTVSVEDKLRIREKVMVFLLNHALCVFREDKRTEGDSCAFSHRIDQIEITNGKVSAEVQQISAQAIVKCEMQNEMDGNRTDDCANKRGNISGTASIIPASSVPTSSSKGSSVNVNCLEPLTLTDAEMDNEKENGPRLRRTSMNKIPSSLSGFYTSTPLGGVGKTSVNLLEPFTVSDEEMDIEKENPSKHGRNMSKKMGRDVFVAKARKPTKTNAKGINKTRFGKILPDFITRRGMSKEKISNWYQSMYWCSECQKEVSSSNLDSHLKVHGIGMYACDKKFHRQILCVQHQKKHHKITAAEINSEVAGGHTPYARIGGASANLFPVEENETRHDMNLNKNAALGKPRANANGANKTRRGKVLPYFITSTGRMTPKINGQRCALFWCSTCEVEFSTRKLTTHLRKHGIGKLPCEVCKKTFCNRAKLEQHKRKYHK